MLEGTHVDHQLRSAVLESRFGKHFQDCLEILIGHGLGTAERRERDELLRLVIADRIHRLAFDHGVPLSCVCINYRVNFGLRKDILAKT